MSPRPSMAHVLLSTKLCVCVCERENELRIVLSTTSTTLVRGVCQGWREEAGTWQLLACSASVPRPPPDTHTREQ